MNRRAFIITVGGGLLAVPLAVEAQPAGKVWRIAVLSTASRENTNAYPRLPKARRRRWAPP